MALPTGQVTLFFSDIEGSTRLLERLGERYGAALGDHQRIVRAAVGVEGGTELRTEGDAFVVAFPSARGAVAAAIAIQRGLAAHAWPEGTRLRVRIGLHTGTPAVVGDDYVGLDVHRAARVCAAAHGAQVVVTEETAKAAGDPDGGWAVRDLGLHRLKDLSLPARLYAIQAEGLEEAFPPLRTLDAHRTNLPAQPTAIVGREREQAELAALLAPGGPRLVTLTGPGGSGKTRLALAVAADAVDAFRDGVFAVFLAPVARAELVVPAIAVALAVRDQPGRAMSGALTDALRDSEALLVLDNLEHVLDTAPELAALLSAGPGLRILATSRAPLRLSMEQEYEVEPLGVPAVAAPPAEVAASASVQLFVERARAVRRDFALDDGSIAAVAEISRRLDGLPLALELAAVHTRLLPAAALLERLSDRLAVLVGGPRDRPDRQRTLRATIDWSHTLLDEREQSLLRRLSVFAGSFGLDAAAAVAGAGSEQELLADLESLVEKSLVRRGGAIGGEPRFFLLETLREYAAERLGQSGEAETVRGRAAEHAAEALERADRAILAGGGREWLDRLDADLPNLRDAMSWAADRGRSDLELRVAAAVWEYALRRAHWHEARQWVAHAVDARPVEDPARRRRALWHLSLLALWDGDDEETRLRGRELVQAAGTDDPVARANGLHAQALAEPDARRGAAMYAEVVGLLRDAGDRHSLARALNNLGDAHLKLEEYETAERWFRESLAMADEAGMPDRIVRALGNLGSVHLERGRPDEARAAHLRALALAHDIGFTEVEAFGVEGFAAILAHEGRDAEAAVLTGAVDARFAELGAHPYGFELQRRERMLAGLERRLGAEVVDDLRAQGRARDFGDVVAELLAGR